MKTFNCQPYDLSDPAISCRADMIGAELFTVHLRTGAKYRVLAFSEMDAYRIADEHDKELGVFEV
jgi:hypothetical protein